MKQTFAKQLRDAMRRMNYRQVDVIDMAAERGIKLGKSKLSQYMNGKSQPRRQTYDVLCDMLGLSDSDTDTSCDVHASMQHDESAIPDEQDMAAVSTPDHVDMPHGEKVSAAQDEVQDDGVMDETSSHVAQKPSCASEPADTSGVASIGGSDSNVKDSTSCAPSFARSSRVFTKSTKLNDVLYDVRGPVVDEAYRMEAQGNHVYKLNIGNPAPFGFRAPDEVIFDMQQQLKECEGYSDSRGLFAARKAIMQYDQLRGIPNVQMEDIYTGNGVSELINLCMQALLDAGDEILIPSPDYPLWTACATLAGGTAVHYLCDEQQDWFPDIADIRSKITPRTKAIVIINPNNPTGAVYSKELLEQIVQIAREFNLIIFSDEIYDRLVMDGKTHTSIASLAPDVFCVTFSGLSKSHMIAGFRIGWMSLSGDKSRAQDYMMGINMLSNMRLCSNVPAQSIVQTALGGYQSVEKYLVPKGRVFEQREFCYNALQQIEGVSVVKPHAAFYMFVKLDPARFNISDDEKFALDLLRQQKVLIVHGKGFNWQTPGYFRIVYLPRLQTLQTAMDKLTTFLSYYHQ